MEIVAPHVGQARGLDGVIVDVDNLVQIARHLAHDIVERRVIVLGRASRLALLHGARARGDNTSLATDCKRSSP